MTGWVADLSGARPGGAALVAAGAVGVVRYAGALTAAFNITADEAADYHAHSLPVAIVCEQRTGDILGGRDVGQQMARAALDDTRAAVLPDGLVYAAGDEDLTLGGPTKPGSPGDVQMGRVHDTLLGFADVLGWANVGFYGSYYAIDWLISKAVPVAAFWQTEAWSHGNVHPRACLFQHISPPQTIPRGCDYNTVVSDWHPRTATPTSGGFVPSLTLVHPERVHPAFIDQLDQLVRLVGHDLDAYSSGRTDAEQQYLYDGWIHHLPGFNPANPPGGKSWHRYVAPDRNGWGVHAQAIDGRTVGLGGATLRDVFGPRAAEAGLCFPYNGQPGSSNEPWHIQPITKHPEVPFGTVQEEDVAIPLPTIDPGKDVGHPATVALFCDLVTRINPASDLSTGAARTQTCKNFQTFFKVAGGADGVCGQKTWAALLAIATKGGK